MCTEFRLKSGLNGLEPEGQPVVVAGRSMEFGEEMDITVVAQNVGLDITSPAPGDVNPHDRHGFRWTVEIPHVFISQAPKQVPVEGYPTAADGLNMAGLSCAGLYLPNYTRYLEISEPARALANLYFCNWALGTCRNVAELKYKLLNNGPLVWGYDVPQMGIVPLHFSAYDQTGAGIVIEFVNAEMKIYDNALGVMTNSPPYDWHLSNVSNYINLSPLNIDSAVFNGMPVQQTGQGSGNLGIPGDATPPSRFIRALMMASAANQQLADKGQDYIVNQAAHILNAVDIPKGFILPAPGAHLGDYTQWSVISRLPEQIALPASLRRHDPATDQRHPSQYGPTATYQTIPLEPFTYPKDLTAAFSPITSP